MTDPNSPASGIPLSHCETGALPPEAYGLTKREHFAGLAMQGITSGFYSDGEVIATASRFCKEQNISPVDYFANMAVEHADALIKVLNKEVKP